MPGHSRAPAAALGLVTSHRSPQVQPTAAASAGQSQGKQQKQQAREKSTATPVRVFNTVFPKDKWEGKGKADTFNTLSSIHMLQVKESVLLAHGLLCTALSLDLFSKAATSD